MGSSFDILKGWETGQIAAILNKVSGGDREKLEAILRDENGRVIPAKSLKNSVYDPNKKLRLIQPKLETIGDFSSRLVHFKEAFKHGSCPTVAEFSGRANKLIDDIRSNKNKNVANLLNGIYLPIILPRLEDFRDYGEALEKIFLPAVKFSYEKQFPNRKFWNYRDGNLEDKVNIAEGTRHEKLLERMAREFVVALYFPNPLQGFSVLASREQLFALPESLMLAGGFDTATAMAMYPDILAKDWYTPGLDLSALSWQSPHCSLFFRADDEWLLFGGWGDLGIALGGCSSGLLFLGSA
ncbi:MAG: hypothetical protein Q7R75_02575 [bacterium]|nr:hypothetical protein [bacterium]